MSDDRLATRELLTLEETIRIFDCSPETVFYWVARGILKPVNSGVRGSEKFRCRDIMKLVNGGSQRLERLRLAKFPQKEKTIVGRRLSQMDPAMFFKAIEQTADAVVITDSQGHIRYVNPAFTKVTGFSQKETIGKTPRILKSGLHDGDFYDKLWSTITSGRVFRGTVVNRRKDGELFHSDLSITPVKESSGSISSFIGIWKDITEQKELERRKDEFISIASHELKTPITSIKAYTQILQRRFDAMSDKNASDLLKRMGEQVDRLAEIVGDMLDVTRIQSGKLVLNKEETPIDDLVLSAANEARLLVEFTGHRQKIIVRGKAGKKISVDRYRLSQVMANLLSNAIKYSPDDGRIFVSVTHNRRGIKIGVSDSGVGIPRREQERIFERFYRVNPSASEGGRFSNLGLGLFISSEIVSQHGGRMWVRSKEGDGSSFYFTLPFKN